MDSRIYMAVMILAVSLIVSFALNIFLLLNVLYLKNTIFNLQETLFNEQDEQSEDFDNTPDLKVIYR